MSHWDADVIVVGAGVAGSSAALLLGQEGYRVLLLDRATFPRHKTCGEGIMPEGVAILAS
ncbi:MAG: FAD-dependent oxidoreductase, partial [Chloroflexi bacterium]